MSETAATSPSPFQALAKEGARFAIFQAFWRVRSSTAYMALQLSPGRF